MGEMELIMDEESHRVAGKSIRTIVFKSVLSYFGLNLLTLLPITAMYFFCEPQVIELEVIEDGAVAIAISGNGQPGNFDNCFSWAELYDKNGAESDLHLFTGQFPRTYDFSSPRFFIRSDTVTQLQIGRVRKVVGVFSNVMSPTEFAAAYIADGDSALMLTPKGKLSLSLKDSSCHLRPGNEPEWEGWSLAPDCALLSMSSFIAFAGFEVLLLLVVVVAAVICTRRGTSAVHRHVWQTMSLSAIAAFFFLYVVPLQSYYANTAEFPFSSGQLMLSITPLFMIAFVVVFVGLALTEPLFGRLAHFVLFSFLVYEYLETGVLLRNAPSFTGEMTYYCDIEIQVRDCILFAYIMFCGFVLYSKFKNYFTWMLSAISVMFLASLIDAVINAGSDVVNGRDSSTWACGQSAIPRLVSYSSRRNVIVFVLDSVTCEAAKDAAREMAVESFDGFTAYDMNLGTQSRSELSTVGFFTGECFTEAYFKKAILHNFTKKIIKEGSVLCEYLESPNMVYCMLPTPQFNNCYTSVPYKQDSGFTVRQNISNPLMWCPEGNPMSAMSIMMLSVFKTTPFVYKPDVFQWFCPMAGHASEEYLYPVLRSAPVKNDVGGAFLYFHTHGAHIPHDVSGDGVRRGVLPPSYRANLDHVKSVFRELAKTFDAYRERGIYDCSTILVIADHGAHALGDAKHPGGALPPVAFPMLWVKPANSRGPIVFDETTPTTHASIHKVLRRLKDEDLTADEMAKMLSSERRTFIRQTRDGYDEWIVKEDGSVESFAHHKVD